ncbi:predicted protein [Sclerotinia sclerotiorum 1980 UF-70]|uniref:Uncharacterized protein n=1 Tax=Sclerotinia sclerotiorum (strain ATCC 18683 / 1980 / Ss-1) TaxID=665079 RepID=A7F9Q3_SCLS1|nr:predicted protein [Sclerotinia sclerotiorum 1980 UF-70]EDO00464.1 predicted protein [Sclerotinia sclerotiorum 1980 UF-70]
MTKSKNSLNYKPKSFRKKAAVNPSSAVLPVSM